MLLRCGCCWCGDPAGEQGEGVVRRRAGLGRIDEHSLSRIGGQVECLEVEREIADDCVMETLHTAAMQLDVVGRPANTKLRAARRQLADQLRESPVVRIAP